MLHEPPKTASGHPEIPPVSQLIRKKRPEIDWEWVDRERDIVFEMFKKPEPKCLVRLGDGEVWFLEHSSPERCALELASAIRHTDCLGLPDYCIPNMPHEHKPQLIQTLREYHQIEVDDFALVSSFIFTLAVELIGWLAKDKRVLWINNGADKLVDNLNNAAFKDYYGLHGIMDNHWIDFPAANKIGRIPESVSLRQSCIDTQEKLTQVPDFDLSFVGAGIAGKMICHHIKSDLGKNAVDIGSVLGAMQGRRERSYEVFRKSYDFFNVAFLSSFSDG